MSKIVEVELNKAESLVVLGTLYHSAADAIKEYVSNALDEWQRAVHDQRFKGPCVVNFQLIKKAITIDYNAPGMDEEEFETALKNVVTSSKPGQGIPQIGYLGIGLWSFNQIGNLATFYSKRDETTPTVKVALRRGSSNAEFSTP